MRTCENVPHQVCSAPRTPGRPSAHLRQRELTGLNQRGVPVPGVLGPAHSSGGTALLRTLPPAWGLEIPGLRPTALSHPCQPHTRPAHCHLIFALGLGLAWLLVDPALGWLPFSPGHSSVCVSRWTGQTLCWVGAPITLLLGVQSAPLSTPLTLACYLGKAGSGVREGGEEGGKEEAPS